MNKREMDMLEAAFSAEVTGALTGGPTLYQTKSKVAPKLVEEGYLTEREETFGSRWPRVTVRGYALTDLGRMTYCMSCTEADLGPE